MQSFCVAGTVKQNCIVQADCIGIVFCFSPSNTISLDCYCVSKILSAVLADAYVTQYHGTTTMRLVYVVFPGSGAVMKADKASVINCTCMTLSTRRYSKITCWISFYSHIQSSSTQGLVAYCDALFVQEEGGEDISWWWRLAHLVGVGWDFIDNGATNNHWDYQLCITDGPIGSRLLFV